MQIYIAGPMRMMPEDQEYRKIIRKVIEDSCPGILISDPNDWGMEEVEGIDKKRESENARKIVDRDLGEIRKSDLVVAYLPDVVSCGTPMEIFYASAIGVHVVGIAPGKSSSPWITCHCNNILTSLDKFKEWFPTSLIRDKLYKEGKI